MAIALDKLSPADLERYLHLQRITAEQEEAAARVRALRAYYDGDHPVLLTDRQQEYLGGLLDNPDFGFAHNLVRSVIDTLRERLSVTGIAVEGAADADPGTPEATVSAALWEWWTKARLPPPAKNAKAPLCSLSPPDPTHDTLDILSPRCRSRGTACPGPPQGADFRRAGALAAAYCADFWHELAFGKPGTRSS